MQGRPRSLLDLAVFPSALWCVFPGRKMNDRLNGLLITIERVKMDVSIQTLCGGKGQNQPIPLQRMPVFPISFQKGEETHVS